MNDVTLLREAGPTAPPLSSAARSAARVALLDEIERSRTVRGRVSARLPRRRTALRIAAGVSVTAVAWTAAVVIAAPDELGPPPGSVTLVDFETPTFPLSLDPVPEGLRPAFDGSAEGSFAADYRDAAGQNGFTLVVHDEEPDVDEYDAHLETEEVEEIRVAGVEGFLVRGRHDVPCEDGLSICGSRSFTQLAWEHGEDVWLRLEGDGRYRSVERLLEVADSVVDRPQPATLRMGLAPAGWSVEFFKMGRVLSLVNDAYEQQTLTVHIPLPEDVGSPEELLDQLMGPIGPVIPVTVHGRPALLVRVDTSYLDEEGWYLQAQFEDGTVFVVQAPGAFTQEQVVEMAEQVTYNP
jgi:hypothetical protein